MWKNIPPRCKHGERMMTGIASITLDVESGNSLSLVQHFAVGLSVDLSDCVSDVQINSLLYCSDQDEIHATVWKFFALTCRLYDHHAVQSARRLSLDGQLSGVYCLLGKVVFRSGQDLVADLSGCVSLASILNSTTALNEIRLSPPSRTVSFRRMLC